MAANLAIEKELEFQIDFKSHQRSVIIRSRLSTH